MIFGVVADVVGASGSAVAGGGTGVAATNGSELAASGDGGGDAGRAAVCCGTTGGSLGGGTADGGDEGSTSGAARAMSRTAATGAGARATTCCNTGAPNHSRTASDPNIVSTTPPAAPSVISVDAACAARPRLVVPRLSFLRAFARSGLTLTLAPTLALATTGAAAGGAVVIASTIGSSRPRLAPPSTSLGSSMTCSMPPSIGGYSSSGAGFGTRAANTGINGVAGLSGKEFTPMLHRRIVADCSTATTAPTHACYNPDPNSTHLPDVVSHTRRNSAILVNVRPNRHITPIVPRPKLGDHHRGACIPETNALQRCANKHENRARPRRPPARPCLRHPRGPGIPARHVWRLSCRPPLPSLRL